MWIAGWICLRMDSSFDMWFSSRWYDFLKYYSLWTYCCIVFVCNHISKRYKSLIHVELVVLNIPLFPALDFGDIALACRVCGSGIICPYFLVEASCWVIKVRLQVLVNGLQEAERYYLFSGIHMCISTSFVRFTSDSFFRVSAASGTMITHQCEDESHTWLNWRDWRSDLFRWPSKLN